MKLRLIVIKRDTLERSMVVGKRKQKKLRSIITIIMVGILTVTGLKGNTSELGIQSVEASPTDQIETAAGIFKGEL